MLFERAIKKYTELLDQMDITLGEIGNCQNLACDINDSYCSKCPVFDVTGKKYCEGTPFSDIVKIKRNPLLYVDREFRVTIVKQIRFLESFF